MPSSNVTPLDPSRYRKITVLTGAGISVASGLRPYRGPGGLWEEHPELAEIATAAAAERDPAAPWRAFCPWRESLLRAKPNAAHLALAGLEERRAGKAEITIITQNVDGLHQRAGSQRVVELHGSIARSRCSSRGCSQEPFSDERSGDVAPPCPTCGAPLRPDVVLFDEDLPVAAERAAKLALRDCDLFMAIGTSGTVSPASNFVRSAEYEGAMTILVNLTPMTVPNPAFKQVVLGKAEEVVPRLLGLG